MIRIININESCDNQRVNLSGLTRLTTNNISIATGVDAQITQAYAIGVAHTAISTIGSGAPL